MNYTIYSIGKFMRKWLASFLFALLIVCTFFVYLRFEKKKRFQSRETFITKIIQTGPQKEALKTDVLAELLGLSIDHRTSLVSFDLKAAAEKLLQYPLIKKAKVEIYDLETLYIDYTLYQPCVWVGDAENLAMDRDKFLFPFFPFFTPKKMTQFYLGLRSLNGIWNRPLEATPVDLAFQIFDFLQDKPFFISRIDVSQAEAKNLGKREVVVVLEKGHNYHYLRLTPKKFKKQLKHYFKLCQEVEYNEDIMVDLRVPQLAFIQKR